MKKVDLCCSLVLLEGMDVAIVSKQYKSKRVVSNSGDLFQQDSRQPNNTDKNIYKIHTVTSSVES